MIKQALIKCLNKTDRRDCLVVDLDEQNKGQSDICIVAKPMSFQNLKAKILICSSELAVDTAQKGTFSQIVTVGNSQRDTVTLSAVSENHVTVSFQREITPLMEAVTCIEEIRTPRFDENQTALRSEEHTSELQSH